MAVTKQALSAHAVATMVGGRIQGNGDKNVNDIADLQSASPEDLSFLSHPKYAALLASTQAGAVLLSHKDAARMTRPEHVTFIVCDDSYLGLAKVAKILCQHTTYQGSVHPTAWVDPSCRLPASVVVGPMAVIEAGAHLAQNVIVEAHAFVGRGATVGPQTHLHVGAKILWGVTLGARVIVQAGAVIGSDGFGYAVDTMTGERHKIPQLGTVVIGDDVEIGANTTIDRATFGQTVIGRGCKLDNLVQVAHNARLGEHCIVVSQTGIAGSTTLDDRVLLGAQSGVAGHLHIASDVHLAARAGVAQDIDAPGAYGGTPAMPHAAWLRQVSAAKDLPALRTQMRRLSCADGDTSRQGRGSNIF